MTATSQNGFPVPPEDLYRFVIPGAQRTLTFVNGPVGFILAVHALWFHEEIELLSGGTYDDWSYDPSQRNVRDGDDLSNHCSATAMDLNATQHPRISPRPGGVAINGFDASEIRRIRKRLRFYHALASGIRPEQVVGRDSNDRDGGWVVRWGYDYNSSVDGMHFEWNRRPGWRALRTDRPGAVVLAERLHKMPRGMRVARANPDAWPNR